MTTSTYTLQTKAASEALALVQVPATEESINQLIVRIMQENEPDARITLKFGTCSLMCDDEAEREEFGTRVKVWFALETLFAARE